MSQTDMMLVCSVILYDPNVRDYIHTYTSKTRFRLERFRCRPPGRLGDVARRRARTTVGMVNGEKDEGSTMSLYDALGVRASATKTEVR